MIPGPDRFPYHNIHYGTTVHMGFSFIMLHETNALSKQRNTCSCALKLHRYLCVYLVCSSYSFTCTCCTFTWYVQFMLLLNLGAFCMYGEWNESYIFLSN